MSMANDPAVIYIVDDNPAVLDAIRWLVEEVGLLAKAFATPQEFVDELDPQSIGCVVLDVRMPGMSGLELQDFLSRKKINLPIIMVTGHGDVPMAVRAMKKGAFEFLQKPFNDQILLDTIISAIKHHKSVVAKTKQRQKASEILSSLTRREKQVLDLVRGGESSRKIAQKLNISIRTVEGHRAKIMDKLNAHTVAQLLKITQMAEQTSFE
ncbi:MAG: response regulator [Granulosicoccus sp.]|nr:response regulator [Granulosicoccus sp.]